MLLENKYYKIVNVKQEGLAATFTVEILSDCNVYEGHFPGNPVCPGVCNIETIKECASQLLGKPLTINTIKQCRLTAIATPTVCPQVSVSVNITQNADTYTVIANIYDDKQSYMDFKGTLS